MKSRISFYVLIAFLLFALAGVYFFYSQPERNPTQTFSATINRDCAPWDGAAFKVQVPLNDGSIIDISIWQSPDIHFPRKFSFPDESGQVGNAILIHPIGSADKLLGDVSFQRVQLGIPVEGRFSLRSERVGEFEGQFRAEWGDQIIMCG